MKRILILLIGLMGVAHAQYAPTSAKTKFVNGLSIGSKDSTYFTNAGDTIVLYFGRDSAVYARFKGIHRRLAYAGGTDFVPYTGAVTNVNLGNYRLTARSIKTDSIYANSSAGMYLTTNTGTAVAHWGAGGSVEVDFKGFAGYDANRASSYTARSFTDKNYVDSSAALRVRYTDTAAMLSPFVQYSDTANMLSPYRRTSTLIQQSEVSGLSTSLAAKLNISDTATMLSPYRRTSTKITNSDLVNSTISGIALGSSLNNLSAGNGITGTAYNGSAAQTWRVDTSVISTKANVTGLLTGYATAASLSGYLPLSGGTLTGALNGTSLSMSGAGSFGESSGTALTLNRVTSGNNVDINFYNPITTAGNVARIRMDGDGISNTFGALSFWTTQSAGSLLERGRFASDGTFLINTTTTDGTNKLIVNGGVKFGTGGTTTITAAGAATFSSSVTVGGALSFSPSSSKIVSGITDFAIRNNADNTSMLHFNNSTLAATFTGSVYGIGFRYAYAAKSSNYTLTDNDDYINVTSSCTITLPTAVGRSGKRYVIKCTGSAVATIASTSSQTIDGNSASTYTFGGPNFNIMIVYSDGSNWFLEAWATGI